MILIELIQELVCLVLRFFVWIVTARDCKHCQSHYTCYGLDCCSNLNTEDCINSITRKHFRREERK